MIRTTFPFLINSQVSSGSLGIIELYYNLQTIDTHFDNSMVSFLLQQRKKLVFSLVRKNVVENLL
jgi:hypothetical protein